MFQDFNYLRNNNKIYNIKFKSFWFYFNYKESYKLYSRLKKIEFPTSSVNIQDLNKVLENSYQDLCSIDVGINNRVIYLDSFSMWELDLDENEEKTIVLNNITNFGKLLKKCENLKKLSLRDNVVFRRSYYKSHSKVFTDDSYKLLQDSINNSILQLNKLTKLHFYGIQIKSNDFFLCLSQAKLIKSLKLINVNFKKDNNNIDGSDVEIYNQFIQYLYGNKNLVKLSIRDNDLDSDDHNNQLLEYLSKSSQLSNLNISYNYFNLEQLFKQIYTTNQKYQFSKITIADNQLLPFNLLLNTNITNFINIKYHYGNKRVPVILTKPIVLEFQNQFYNIPSEFIDISF